MPEETEFQFEIEEDLGESEEILRDRNDNAIYHPFFGWMGRLLFSDQSREYRDLRCFHEMWMSEFTEWKPSAVDNDSATADHVVHDETVREIVERRMRRGCPACGRPWSERDIRGNRIALGCVCELCYLGVERPQAPTYPDYATMAISSPVHRGSGGLELHRDRCNDHVLRQLLLEGYRTSVRADRQTQQPVHRFVVLPLPVDVLDRSSYRKGATIEGKFQHSTVFWHVQ